MFEAKGLLEAYLNGVLGLSGAASASVFIPTPWSRASQAILIQAGAGPSLAELADLETAAAFCSRAASEGPRAGSRLGPGVSVLKSTTPGGVLLPIPLITQLWQRVVADPLPDRGAARASRRATDRESGVPAAGWLGLRFTDEEIGTSSEGARWRRADAGEFWVHLLALAGSLASYYVRLYGVLTDPLTGLPGRPEFLSLLREDLNRSRETSQSYSLLLVNPDRFECVNDRCGREAADAVIREIVAKLQTACRRTDLLARHGAAVFAVGLSASTADTALAVGEKIRRHLSEHRYLNEDLPLEFSVGAATVDVGEPDVDELELIRRADIGLGTAKLEGGCRTAMLRTESDRLLLAPRDRLSGIFTGDAETDYRNMGLLWDALTAIASNTDASRLAALVVDKLTLLRAARIALFECDAGAHPRLLSARSGPSGQAGPRAPIGESDLLPAEIALARQVASTGQAAQRAVAATPEADGIARPLAAYAIPLRVGSRVVGVLLIVGAQEQLRLSPSDLPFL
ncbi:MAG: GGDEF domain-containing protein, partial [Planctomycetes bacterium]|nr:GGDEF domain-containing protein [Planctomycetota bacterium]